MRHVISFFILICVALNVTLVLGQSLQSKQLKMQACSVLSRDRLMKDKDYFLFVATFVDPNGNENERIQHLLSILMLSCFKNINNKIAENLIVQAQDNKINSLSEENKALVNLEQWDSIYSSNDENLIKNEMSKYQDVIRDLRQVQQSLQQQSQQDNQDSQYNQESNDYTNRNEDSEDYEFMRNRKPEMNILGYDISKLTNETKLFIGGSLLILLFAVFIFYAKKAIGELPATKVKVSKKKKDKAE